MGAMAAILLILNLLGGIVSGIWLALIGEWWALGVGLVSLLVSHFVIGILLMPGLLFDLPAIALFERGRHAFAYVLGGISTLYTAALMTGWGIGILFFFASLATTQSVIPLLIWSYGVASGPWSFLASKDQQAGGNEYSAMSMFFFQSGYLTAMVSVLVSRSLALGALVLAAIMGVDWLLQMILLRAQVREEALMHEGESAV